MDRGAPARPPQANAADLRSELMTSLVWARPDALWLLLLAPFVATTGIWFGVRRRRISNLALGLRLLVVVLLAIGLAEPMLASGSGAGGAVFVVDRSDSIGA